MTASAVKQFEDTWRNVRGFTYEFIAMGNGVCTLPFGGFETPVGWKINWGL